MRIVLGIEYEGSQYHGWQIQAHDPLTIQADLEKALAQITCHPVRVACAGRTDAGVHAFQQVVHFDTSVIRPGRAWTAGTNTHLPKSIRVRWSCELDDTFHARFSATARRYRYFIYNHASPTAVWHRHACWYRRPLDVAAMQVAAQYLLGEHDFSAFRGSGCQAKHPRRSIYDIAVSGRGPWIILDIQANGFLLHMVRNIVGSLLVVGCGDQPTNWLYQVLKSCDRKQAGITAPPQGLYFVEPTYPAHFQIPAVQSFAELFPYS